MKIKIHWFVSIVLFLILFTTTYSEENDIKISALTIQPGEFTKIAVNGQPNSIVWAKIAVNGQPNSIVWAKFLGNTKELQYYNNQYLGFASASYYAVPGVYPLLITIITDNQITNREYSVEVTPRKFPEDRIRVPEKTRQEILTDNNRNSDTKQVNNVREKAKDEVLPPLWEGTFLWPIHGQITTKFGLIRYVNDIENGRHSGLDIAAPTGTPITASNKGRIVFAGKLYLTGLTVIIHHGLDLFTSYGHLSKIEVKEGDEVRRGDMIGKVGMTGLATGPHLHLTFRIGETPVDPYLFLEKELQWP